MENLHCQYCGNSISTTESCPKCGTLLPFVPIGDDETGKLCSTCSAPNRSSASFCYLCGNSLVKRGKLMKVESIPASLHEILEQTASEEINRILVKEGGSAMNSAPIRVKKGQKRIGLWGPHASGKTAYMLSLYLASRQSGFEWLIGLDDVDDQARAFFDGISERFLNGDFPPANPPDQEEPDIYNFMFYPVDEKKVVQTRAEKDELDIFWSKVKNWFILEVTEEDKKKFPGIAISFADVAGERYLLEKSDSVLWKHIAGCHGLICLIDPEDFKQQFQITNRLGGLLHQKVRNEHPELLIDNGRYLPHYISVCFSKVDRPDWKEYSENPEGLISELERSTRVNIQRILGVDFSPERTHYHCISSVGLNAEVDQQKILNPDNINPYNIFAPLNEWVKKVDKI